MVKVREDMTGWIMAEHGVPDSRWTVIEQADDYVSPSGKHYAQWLCKCSCGKPNYVKVRGKYLKNGESKSCGCLAVEQLIVRNSKTNKYSEKLHDEYGEYYVGWTTNTNAKFYVDADDYDKIKDYCWTEHILQGGYHALETRRPGSKQIIRMHYLIVGRNFDHKDRNPLNNRKFNLRAATRSENNQNRSMNKNNTSGIKGVHWHKKQCKWHAYITLNYKRIHLGSFVCQTDAIKARLQGELVYFQPGFEPQRHLFEEYGVTKEVLL